MKVDIKLDPSCKEPTIIIQTNQMNEELQSIIDYLSEKTPQVLAGFQNDIVEVLDPSMILRIFALNGKVYAKTTNKDYVLKLRLYEVEERLDKNCFLRISNSEIINIKKVKGFDLSFVGTICVTLTDGSVTYVSRRYVGKIKQMLGI